MLIRYEGAYTASTVVIMGDRSGFVWEQRPVYNFIDDLVDAGHQRPHGDDEGERRDRFEGTRENEYPESQRDQSAQE